MKRGKFKRIAAIAMSAIMMLSVVACGASSSSSIDDEAATRGAEEGAGEFWIDEGAIAKADSAASSQAALDACSVVFNLINQQRVAQGLSELKWSVALTNAAQVRANEIVSTFSHTRPDGSAFWTVDSNVQYGENLAKLYQSADSVYTAWMNSPTHAANIMDSDFKTVGIAICQTGTGDWYWAQEFGY
ncbi:MAG: CAP domain-containing protein [Butyrivibrio sp.]|nr:CAP domain-containing protein [Butyrivibrio sp.]